MGIIIKILWETFFSFYSEENLFQGRGFRCHWRVEDLGKWGNNMTPTLKQQHLLWFKATQKLLKQANVLDCTDKCGSMVKATEQKKQPRRVENGVLEDKCL